MLLLAWAVPAWAKPSAPPAEERAILGTIPPYPGASRPLPAWETPHLAIALTPDPLPVVTAYYVRQLLQAGWTAKRTDLAAARAAADADQPVWLPFKKSGLGRLDLQLTPGKHPKTGQRVTLIFYQATYRL